MEIPFGLAFPGSFVLWISGKKFQSIGMTVVCSVFWCLFQLPYGCTSSSQTGLCNWLLSKFFSSRVGETTANGRSELFGIHPLLFTAQPLFYVSWASSVVGSRTDIRKTGISGAPGIGNVTSRDRDGGQVSPALRNHLCCPLLLLTLLFHFLLTQVLCSCASAPGQFFWV